MQAASGKRQAASSQESDDTTTERFHYNALKQLTSVDYENRASVTGLHLETKEYQWDAFGNPQTAQHGAGDTEVRQDRLFSLLDQRFGYDDCGNQIKTTTKGQRQHRRFNGLNQLIELQINGRLIRYQYDALGRRTAKLTEAGRTEYLWDGDQLVGEHTQGKFRWYLYEPETFLPVACIENAQIYWYHLDQLGTPCTALDSLGQQVWQLDSDPFGLAVSSINDVCHAFDNPLRFQGQYFDQESGLHYNRYRYYCPKQQRFINQDPIGLAGGINAYQYTPNPVNWVDPLGLLCKEGQEKVAEAINNNPNISPELEAKLVAVSQLVDSPYTADEMVEHIETGNADKMLKEDEAKQANNQPAQSINEAEIRLIAAKQAIITAQQQGKPLPASTYTLADKLAVIENGLEENILVRVIETSHAGDSGTIGQVKNGRSVTWTAPMSQVEHADSDAELLLNAFGTRHDPTKSYTLLLIDRKKVAEEGDIISFIPTFDNLNAMIADNPDIGISPVLSKQVMNKDFAPKYEAFANQGWDAGIEMNEREDRINFAINLGHDPKTAKLLSKRHQIAKDISAWEIFTGNGMTRDTNVKGKVAYGPVEVFSYDKNPQQLGKLEKSGALKRRPLD